jgi:hypothetical protein
MSQLVASFGGGTNSTAMLIEMVRRQERVDAVVFSDTGCERPDTYRHISEFSDWLRNHGYPEIVTIRSEGKYRTLEAECLDKKRFRAPRLALLRVQINTNAAPSINGCVNKAGMMSLLLLVLTPMSRDVLSLGIGQKTHIQNAIH